MQFSEQWLRTWCNPKLNTQEMAHALTMAGLEVEEIQSVSNIFEHIVIAVVKDVQPHPNADKLRICMVDVGQNTLLQIVCGAINVRVGIKVPCALVGAYIDLNEKDKNKTRLDINASQLRGVDSYGMLCSAQELGLMNINQTQQNGLLELNKDAPIGENICKYLNLDDYIFTIKLTPNRADCLSIHGIARDLSAITNTPLQSDIISKIDINVNENTLFDTSYQISIDDKAHDLCSHFSLREIKHIKVEHRETPVYIKQRLERSGLRSVNILVDISNYVMLELGQPSHIFDASLLGKQIHVHWSNLNNTNTTLELLNGVQVIIQEKTGLISDEQGVQCLAGVMGGKHTSVTNHTTNIVIECAFWYPHAIAGKTKQYKINSDAAYRYERGVDPYLNKLAIERITQLIIMHCSTEQTQISNVKSVQAKNIPLDNHNYDNKNISHKKITLAIERIYNIIGTNADIISINTILDILFKLNLQPHYNIDACTIEVCIPSYRFDLNIAEDIIEEIIRIYGFDRIQAHRVQGHMQFIPINTKAYSVHDVRCTMAHLGYNEVLSFGFTSSTREQHFADKNCVNHPIYLKNPIAEQYNVMRSNLIGGLVEKLVYNQQQHRPSNVRLFEVGKVFRINTQIHATLKQVKNIQENYHIAGIVNGLNVPQQWGNVKRSIDFYDVKGDIETLLKQHKNLKFTHPNTESTEEKYSAMHPGRYANIFIGEHFIGRIGELHPEIIQVYAITGTNIVFELDLTHVLLKPNNAIEPVNKFPAIKRDIAVIVDDKIAANILIDAIYNMHTDEEWPQNTHILNVDIFDVFKPNHQNKIHENDANNNDIAMHEKSIALQFFVQKQASTLSEKEAEHIMQMAMEALQKFGRVRDHA